MCKCSQEQSKMWPAGGMKGTNPIYLLSKKTIWQFRNTAIYFETKESKNLYENNTMGLARRRITPNLSFQGKDQRDNLRPQLCTYNQEHKESMQRGDTPDH